MRQVTRDVTGGSRHTTKPQQGSPDRSEHRLAVEAAGSRELALPFFQQKINYGRGRPLSSLFSFQFRGYTPIRALSPEPLPAWTNLPYD
jgi:hypothetical protein